MLISFIAGIAVCSLIIFGARTAIPTQAAEKTAAGETSSSSSSSGLVKLLPDIETIYHDALTMPFIKAESKIYDEDILEFYRDLMEKTGLTDSGIKADITQ
jgi:hypothetical protein